MRYSLLILALSGVAYCILTPLGYMPKCISQGCLNTSDFKFAGISFYHLGALFFGLISFLTFLLIHQDRHPTLNIGRYRIESLIYVKRIIISEQPLILLYSIGIAFEILLLVFQVFFFQCLSCLIVAVFVITIGLLLISLYRNFSHTLLVTISIGLFVCAVGKMILSEYNPLTYGYSGKSNTRIVYFNENSVNDNDFINLIKKEDGSLLFIYYLGNLKSSDQFIHTAHALTATKSIYSLLSKQSPHQCEADSISLTDKVVYLLFGYANAFTVRNFPLIQSDTVVISEQRSFEGLGSGNVNPFRMFNNK